MLQSQWMGLRHWLHTWQGFVTGLSPVEQTTNSLPITLKSPFSSSEKVGFWVVTAILWVQSGKIPPSPSQMHRRHIRTHYDTFTNSRSRFVKTQHSNTEKVRNKSQHNLTLESQSLIISFGIFGFLVTTFPAILGYCLEWKCDSTCFFVVLKNTIIWKK